ncbi:hypothetical protein [Demequina lignilytica]|uniref:Uncharacterized protein n=1 Tax=Demequina lignilytica TaxID=3051663 RepID=A0AB35MGR4_9MICO|nr:hypothetical protein [Demequina sp. SYSU T0a273]MDN4482910.1 hypothetical protein [Demequina sp. SYSU T0a273]
MNAELGAQAGAGRGPGDDAAGATASSGAWSRIANPRRVTLADDAIEVRPEGGLVAGVDLGELTAHDRVRYPAA